MPVIFAPEIQYTVPAKEHEGSADVVDVCPDCEFSFLQNLFGLFFPGSFHILSILKKINRAPSLQQE
jgi:hypothetical protein